MKIIKWTTILVVFLLFSIAAYPQTSVVFNVKSIALSNGYSVSGTITTDGTIGPLTAANVLAWKLKVVQTTDFVWTEKNSSALNIAGVSSDGKKIYVATSPDGVLDGGTLYFSKGAAGGNIATSALIADFTQMSTNLGYVGGMAGWQDELWGLNFLGLNQRNNIQYQAASALSGRPNVFLVRVPTIATTPLLVTMFGTITTDGTVGPLLPRNLLAWKITARNREITYYSKQNSAILSAIALSSDGAQLKVDRVGGQLAIGIAGRRPTFVTLADFTDPTMPKGFANYYLGTMGVMGSKSPLLGSQATTYVIATKQ